MWNIRHKRDSGNLSSGKKAVFISRDDEEVTRMSSSQFTTPTTDFFEVGSVLIVKVGRSWTLVKRKYVYTL